MENFISRAPRMQVTDVRARVSGADRVRMRLEDLAAKRGAGFLSGLFRKMITETAEGAWPWSRRAITSPSTCRVPHLSTRAASRRWPRPPGRTAR